MNKIILFPSAVVALAALGIVLVSEMTPAQVSSPTPVPTGPNIVAVITADPNLTTLVSALRAAELVEVLEGRGPFTLFAPNNAAFAKLPAGTLATLMMPENKKKLANILRHHVVRDRIMAADVSDERARTLDGGKVGLSTSDGKVFFGKSAVLAADKDASNGVIHIIDTVEMPD